MKESMVEISDFAKYIGLSMLSKNISVSPLKLQKVLYYEQAWHMVFFGRACQLFSCAPQAWVNGPVYPSVYHEYKNCVGSMCDYLNASHFGVEDDSMILCTIGNLAARMNLSNEQIEVIDSVLTLYGSKSQNQLIFVSHCELPWSEAREGLLPYQASEKPISLDTMYSYYKERHDRNRAAKR